MFKTPKECYDYIVKNEMETAIIGAMMQQTDNYSIAEIADARFHNREGKISFTSAGYKINIEVTDDEIVTAVLNGLYVSAFLSRKDDNYRVHFSVSGYPAEMKARFEEEITKEVVRYMIMSVIMACRLDSEKKLKIYIGNE